MTDDYYGYRPISYPAYGGMRDDYAADRAAQATPYQPTDWDGVNIEQMWEYVRKESNERTVALAEMWRRAASLLESTRDNLKRHADALGAKWNSPASRVFMSKVGATLHSLDEWKNVASSNATGLDQLASKISTAQREMTQLWLEYKAEQQHQQDVYEKDKAKITFSDIFGDKHKSYEEVQKEFHQRAKNITKPLADMYIDVYISNISRGGKFKGPTEAALFDGKTVPGGPGRTGGPTRPGAVPPGARGPRPDRPEMPNRPEQPNQPEVGARPPQPSAPTLPDGVDLAGGTATVAPPGPAPTPPPVTTAPNAPGTPGPPLPPVVPPGQRPGGGGPGTPNPGGRPNAPRATLPGSGGAPGPGGGRGPAPNRPTLPGAGGGSGAPGSGRRGPAPNRPTLPGNTGAPGRPGAGALRPKPSAGPPPSSPRLPGSTAPSGQRGAASGRPAAPPPSLGGQRGATPGTPPKAGGPLGSRPATPPGGRASGPGAKGSAGRPDLSGRTGAARPAPATGPGPSLSGRRGAPAAPGARKGTQHDLEQETWEYGDGDDELWVTESSAVGVVEAPAEHRPREQGRTLGQS
ncbi:MULTISPECIES: hypothetical protein [Micromonospora]|uniref:hypothetical protein n=1 Tax=Micromonospora TaxID=1873 RepID=UPI001315352C|nr:hypothetical protein [Verrucosispora sp. FIM060022]